MQAVHSLHLVPSAIETAEVYPKSARCVLQCEPLSTCATFLVHPNLSLSLTSQLNLLPNLNVLPLLTVDKVGFGLPHFLELAVAVAVVVPGIILIVVPVVSVAIVVREVLVAHAGTFDACTGDVAVAYAKAMRTSR